MDHAVSIRRLYDLINAGDIDGFGRQLADDFVERAEVPGIPPTKAGVVQYFRMLLAAFPDFRMDVEDVIAGGGDAAGYGLRRLCTSGGAVSRAIQGDSHQAAALTGGRCQRQKLAPATAINHTKFG